MNLKGAKLIDFTGGLPEASRHERYSNDVARELRAHAANSATKVAVVIDHGFGMADNRTHLVLDHLNLTGDNPLLGPNDPVGERFPVVNGIYLSGKVLGEGALSNLPEGVLGGLRDGNRPTAEEEKLARRLGAQYFSYNLVPTMIVAAHAGYKVLGIVVPEKVNLDEKIVAQLNSLIN